MAEYSLRVGRKKELPPSQIDRPTAADLRAVIKASCIETGENEELVFSGYRGVRARYYAGQALAMGFPDITLESIAWMVGQSQAAATFKNALTQARNASWWDDKSLDRVLTVLASGVKA